MDFYQVYDDYYDRVRRFIQASVKNPWVADDLVQETFLRILQNFSQIRDQAKMSAWIYRIAANLCQDHFRIVQKNLIPFDENTAEELPGGASLEEQVEHYELSLWVQERIKLLPEPWRQVVFLCDIKQESYQEVADLLGISLDNVKVRLYRGRKRLKALLEEQGASGI